MNRSRTSLWILGLLALLALPVVVDVGWRGLQRFPQDPVQYVPEGDARRGRQLIIDYGCGGCHVVPGIRVATGRVGPQLVDFRQQIYVAGVLPNRADELVEWITSPREINPRTAMPDLDVTPEEARDIAAYLYSFPREPWRLRPRGAERPSDEAGAPWAGR